MKHLAASECTEVQVKEFYKRWKASKTKWIIYPSFTEDSCTCIQCSPFTIRWIIGTTDNAVNVIRKEHKASLKDYEILGLFELLGYDTEKNPLNLG